MKCLSLCGSFCACGDLPWEPKRGPGSLRSQGSPWGQSCAGAGLHQLGVCTVVPDLSIPTAAQKRTQSCPLCCCESPWLSPVSAQDPLPGFCAEIYSQPEGSRSNSSPAFILCCCLGEYVNCGGTRLFSSCLQMYYFNLDIASLSKQVWIRSILHVIPAAS